MWTVVKVWTTRHGYVTTYTANSITGNTERVWLKIGWSKHAHTFLDLLYGSTRYSFDSNILPWSWLFAVSRQSIQYVLLNTSAHFVDSIFHRILHLRYYQQTHYALEETHYDYNDNFDYVCICYKKVCSLLYWHYTNNCPFSVFLFNCLLMPAL